MGQQQNRLGPPAAERDDELRRYFFESEIFGAVSRGEASILIGSRGSGKSAIFRMVGEREKAKGTAVIQINPEEYSYEFLGKTLKAEVQGVWAKQSSYAASWKHVLYILAMKEAIRRTSSTKTASYKAVRGFLAANFRGEQENILDRLVSYMKRFEGIKIGSLEIKSNAKALQDLYSLEELKGQLEYLKDILVSQKVYIFVDELDRGWDASEDAKQFVAGLFQAAIQVNRLTPNLKVFISLRRELYDAIPEIYDDAQKVRDLVREVRWDEDTLKQMIAKRIIRVAGLPTDSTPDDAWESQFAQTLAYRKTNSFNYIVDRTSYRPREIIQFCNECLADVGTGSLIDYSIIVEAENRYSADRTNDIASEFKFEYPGLKQVMETFRGKVYSMTREELELHCLEILTEERRCPEAQHWLQQCDVHNLVSILWDVGFIKAYAVGGIKAQARSGSRYLGSYQIASLSLLSISQFMIHPMFQAVLGLKEK
jgi:hypothetical protein